MIPMAEPWLDKEELKNVVEAVNSGWVSSKGKFVGKFEKAFARYCGRKHGVATNSGTAALHLALEALGIGKGNQVIVPTLTFITTANVVIYTRANPVFIDSHLLYWCMDPKKIEEKITQKTKAIIPVHLYGHPADMDSIIKIAKKYSLYVVEDAAEAHGAEYKGQKVGSFGDISCFSFFGNKIITTGEGGMCLTNSDELAERLRILRDHGMSLKKQYWYDVIGFNYRMTNMQAAIGLAQLKKIERFVKMKRENARLYSLYLQELKDVTLPPEMDWAKNVYWMYTILVESERASRDKLMIELKANGIDTKPLFYPIHIMPPYKREGLNFPVAESISKKGVSLPSGVKLKQKDIKLICEVIKNYLVK